MRLDFLLLPCIHSQEARSYFVFHFSTYIVKTKNELQSIGKPFDLFAKGTKTTIWRGVTYSLGTFLTYQPTEESRELVTHVKALSA